MFTPKHPAQVPYLVYADQEGNIQEHDRLLAAGRIGQRHVALKAEDFIELPYGSELFFLPGRHPYGVDPDTGNLVLLDDALVVSVFIAPAHTQTYLASYEKPGPAPILPLYAYTAVGWLDDKFYAACTRIDPDIRQDVHQFTERVVQNNIQQFKAKYPGNKLVDHLADHCATEYHCRAAQNFFLNRWECPIPASPACNATCIGCISLQPEEEEVNSAHFRLKFTPDVDEIVEIAVDHLQSAPTPIISFGQGCEGEPLLVWETLEAAIRKIREQTDKGIININTNASRPKAVEVLCQAGLQSIRASLNSVQPDWYNPYYLPRNYSFDDIKESIKVVRSHGGWASINYFIFPGMTDSEQEYEALRSFIRETDITMIQWRNFNIDPDWYFKKTRLKAPPTSMGVKVMMDRIKEEFPWLAYGYFNPAQEKQLEYFSKRASMQQA